jgi:hypothetical protein
MIARQRNGMTAQMVQQVKSQSQLDPSQQHQRAYTETMPFNHFSIPAMHQGGEGEIVHPAPQGHQRNISEALQKEIDATEEIAQTNAHIVRGHVPAATPNGLGNTQDFQHSSLQRLSDGAGENDSHVLGPSPKPLAATFEPISGSHGNTTTDASQSMSNKLSYAADPHTLLLPSGSQGRFLKQANGHKPSASGSKFNVEAREFEFNPRAQFSSSNFVFNEDTSQLSLFAGVPPNGHNSLPKAVLPTSTAAARLNADAPSFKPSTFGKSNFQFNSATFNVEAPEFNPGPIETKNAEDQKVEARSASGTDKIFTNITIDPAGKTTRRGKVSRALPIRQPDESEHTEDDEDGRVRASAARQKRARVQQANGDDVPVYADEMPLQDAQKELVFPESPVPEAASKEEATREAVIETLPNINSTKEDEEGIAATDRLAEAVRIQGTTPALSPQHDSMLTRTQKDSFTVLSPDERSDRGVVETDEGDGLDHSPCHESVASFSPLLLSNGAADKSSGSFSSTGKPQKSVSLHASHYVATPPSSPPVTTVPTELSPRRLATAVSQTRSSPEPTEVDKSNSGSKSFQSENTAPATTIDGIVHAVPPADTLLSTLSSSDEKDPTALSYDEIDAVMKQFGDNPDLGVERRESPPRGGLFLNPSIKIRSDAPSPSPSPRRTQVFPEPEQQSAETTKPFHQFPSGIGIESREIGQNSIEGADISDWNDAISVADEHKFKSRAQFFNSHINSIVGSVLEDRLGPLERRLETIQHSLAIVATQNQKNRRRTSTSDEMKHSDADDEDEENQSKKMVIHRTRSPLCQKKDRNGDVIRTAVREAFAAHKQDSPEVNQSAFEQLLSEVRLLKEASASKQRPDEMKAIVEDVISTHPRLRGKRVQEDHQAGASQKFSLQIDGLESMLKVANERAEEEYRVRRKVEDDLAETDRQFNIVAEEAAQYREASEEAERSLRTYYEQQESFQDLEQSLSEQSLKNAALETTLEEYRLSHDQWLIDMEDERRRSKDLKAVLHSLRREIEESSQAKQSLRARLERVQDDMTDVMENIAHDQASWFRREQELSSKIDTMQAELLRETSMRQKMELELDELEKAHKKVLKVRDAYEVAEKEIISLEALVAQTRQESRTHEDAAHCLGREVNHLREKAEADTLKTRSTHEHHIGMLKSQYDSVSADLEGQISRLKAQLQHTEDDADESKVRHQNHVDELVDRHSRALHSIKETKEAALEEHRSSHERALNDLRERHARALHNASDDRHRLEAHLMEKLALSSDKTQHLEGKVADLQDRLEITTSAARAAAAAAAKGTSESRVPGRPPVTSTSNVSMPLARGSNTPEKISPQALRESIMVLQDQLQYREQNIESLEAELGKVDKDAPRKLKDRDTEISWLRELLGVRIDDLEAIIHAVSEEDYDREAVKDAAIRLKANLQMEQQERERAASGGSGVFQSMSSLSSLTQTPRALPMAAAAAWGNWRKARDLSFGNPSEPADTNSQTPSRSSPQSFLSGLLTPPSVSQRQASPAPSAPPAMMSLNGRMTSSKARPLRAYNGQARSMSARQTEKRPLRRQHSSDHPQPVQQQQQQQQQRRQETPSTPPLMRKSSYDQDADARKSIISDIDDDASLVGSGMEGGGSSLEEPFDESTQ